MSTDNAEELIQRISAKDSEALRVLYEQFSARVFSTALSYLQHREEAEEVVQDVFIEVFDSAGSFKGESTVSTWVYRIAVNKSLDRLRYKKRKKRFAMVVNIFRQDSAELKHDAAHDEHAAAAMEHDEKAQILYRAIHTLPDNQQTAFILSYIEELPQKEVAAVMKLSVKAVESLLQRAKASLRNTLGNIYEGRRK